MRRLATLLLAACTALAACGDDDDAPPPPPPAGPATFTVMTQNLYLGGDLFIALAPGANIPEAVEEIWATVEATDFPSRAELIADSIEVNDPDLVGLQEVSLWRSQTPGDGLLLPNATTVEYDFLDTLQDALTARGLSYRVARTVQNVDVELPGASGTDYRLTDRDVVLAKTSLPIVGTSAGIFETLAEVELPSPTGTGTVTLPIPRGWVIVDFRAGGRTVRLVNTHLEAFSEPVAAAQAAELVVLAQTTARPTVLLGDINLAPGSAGYATFVAEGTPFVDAWTEVAGGDPGLTCCRAPDLLSGDFESRIDVVFATTTVEPTAAVKVNETERTTAGLSPSDHAGVVVEFDATPATTTAAPVALTGAGP